MVFSGHSKIRKQIFRSLVLGLFITVVVFAIDFGVNATKSYRSKVNPDIHYYFNVTSQSKLIALTFDDGPHPEKTLEIMELLKKHGATATFFFMGSHALRHPKIVKTVHENGFEIGNHTYSHAQDVHSSKKRLERELSSTNKILENIIGEPTLVYRPPFLLDIGGDPTVDSNTPSKVTNWISELGYVVAGADVDSLDWAAKSPQEIVDNTMEGIFRGGHIVLMHDGTMGRHTVNALEEIILQARAHGYDFATVSEVLGVDIHESVRLTRDLSFGMTDATTGGEVTDLQTFLIVKGYYRQQTNGQFDSDTERALREWQRDKGIAEHSGSLASAGAATRNVIAAELSAIRSGVSSQSAAFNPFDHILPPRLVQDFYVNVNSVVNYFLSSVIEIMLWLTLLKVSLILILRLRSKRIIFAEDGDQIDVSVLIPVYNEQENLASTVESVLGSNYSRFEILIIDDGSTDNSLNIAYALTEKYPDLVRVITKENGGKASALNLGIQEAKHEIIVSIDSDTVLDKDAIGNLVRHFEDERVSAVAGKVYTSFSTNFLALFQYLEYIIAQNVEKTAMSKINAISVVPGPIGAWRKSLQLELGGYSRDTLVEDQDMTLAVLAAGGKIVYEPRAVVYTETPYNLKDFIKQRSRWVFGGIQCVWKYKSYLFNLRRPSFGFVVLPNAIVFGIIITLIYPIADLLFLKSLLFGFSGEVVWSYLILTALDLTYGVLAFTDEKEKGWLLFLLLFQRLFYRFIIYYVMVKSLIKAIEGTDALWNKVAKKGNILVDSRNQMIVERAGVKLPVVDVRSS